ncbi:hypothetical protein PN498_07205 [Oscillatoria sp. CS-180]|uniref:hypothetical protein n=1 Tax=Oscillatoria sp. CS-180 TaxID=3021720 RepID=UPI00232E8948|nr:hypothetical protein [Oscillatoria sp. CS-180]MDB9525770.1 hypothetical protein [Oscillatoria sp. CS-180]
MNENIVNFLYGALGGGIVATSFRIAETYIIAPRFTQSIDAKKKLFAYARPLSYACYELNYRLDAISIKINAFNETRNSLRISPKEASSIDWFTKEGYYVTSTAYLIATVSCWIQLYERDVVFLQFGRSSLTKCFFELIENFKNSLSSSGSILWFHYVNGIGELLVAEAGDRPMNLSEFTYKLYRDELFRDYYDQLFVFINQMAEGQHLETLKNTINAIAEIEAFLVENKITIAMS